MLELVEKTLDEVLPQADERPDVLFSAMRYALGTGGKRIRPLVCLASAVAVGGKAEDAKYPAAAIELLHNYTLIHDDLPAMDNDRERRGRPTVWVKFGEANAILAGDALLALAYQVAARAPQNVAAIIDALGEAGVGVVRGQVEDVEIGSSRVFSVSSDSNVSSDSRGSKDSRDPKDANDPKNSCGSCAPDFVYRHKTADLFIAAAKMGALAGGGCAADVAALGDFALNLGLAFQYEDDLLDGDGICSREETERLVRETTSAAIAALDRLPGDTTFLRDLAQKLIGRKI